MLRLENQEATPAASQEQGEKLEQICIEGISIDPVSRVAHCREGDISLTPKELSLLLLLVANSNRVLSREAILAEIWGYYSFGSPRTVDVHIHALRKRLGLRKQIRTVAKRGYCFRSDSEGGSR